MVQGCVQYRAFYELIYWFRRFVVTILHYCILCAGFLFKLLQMYKVFLTIELVVLTAAKYSQVNSFHLRDAFIFLTFSFLFLLK